MQKIIKLYFLIKNACTLKTTFQSKKKLFSNEYFQVKLLPEVNKQVGIFLDTNFNTTCGYIKSYNSISFVIIAKKFGTMIVYIMSSETVSENLEFQFSYLENFITFPTVYRLKGV